MICGLCDKAKVTELLCKLPSRYGNHLVNGQWVVDTKNRDQIDMIGFFELTNRHGEWCCAYVDEDHCILTFADGEKACSFAWTIENALEELLQGVVLVGGVDVVAGQAEAHEDALEAQYLLEAGNDGDAAAAAGGDGALAEGVGHSLFGGLVGFELQGTDVGGAAVAGRDLHGDVVGSYALEVVLEHLADFLEILIGDEAGADLGIGLAGKHGLGTFAGVAAPDAAHIEAGTDAGALLGGVAFFALQSLHSEVLLILFLVEGSLCHEGALLVAEHQHVVVEAGDGDVAVLVVQVGNHLAEHVDGVGHSAAEDAAVKVMVGAGHLHLPVAEAAEAAGNRGHVGGNHRGVAHQDDVGF